MRIRISIAALLLPCVILGLGLHTSAQQTAKPAPAPARARAATAPPADDSDLPPLSYVCPTPGEENVVVDKPGTCPKSGAPLVPVRLDIAYSCLRGPRDIRGTAFTCAYDKTDAGPVIASIFWMCKDDPKHDLEPGKCADGTARLKSFEIRPHGDHNPRHGGRAIFMSEDLLHHVEGTWVAPDTFRVYFYDVYTRPMRVTGFSARVARADSNGKEIGEQIPLIDSKNKDANAMEAHVPNVPAPTATANVYFKLHVKVTPNAKDWVTDHQFPDYSKEPAAPVSTVTTGGRTPPTTPQKVAQATKPAAQQAAPPAKAPAAPASQTSAAATPPPPTTTIADTSGASFAGVAAQDILPTTTPELLAELAKRSASVDSLLQEGQLGGMWFPALGAKDVALALEENHASELPDTQRNDLASAVKQVTLSAWQIDAAGDLGNKDRLIELCAGFAAAVTRIETLYGASH